MFTNPAPPPSDMAGSRVAPVANGEVPAPGAVDRIDWSGDARAATVGRLLAATRRLDVVAGEVVIELIRAVDSGATDQVLGAAVEVVLAQSCRLPGFERTALLRAAHVLGRMPATLHEFRTGRMSWAQTRAVVQAAGRLKVGDLSWLDETVAGLVGELHACEGDWLVWEVDHHVDALLAERQGPDRRRVFTANRVHRQPGLDGSGRGDYEFDDAHYPLFATAMDAFVTAINGPLHDGLDTTIDPDQRVSDAALTDAAMHAAKLADVNAQRRAAAMFQLVTGLDSDTLEPAPVGGPGGTSHPSVLVTCTVNDLLGPAATGSDASAGDHADPSRATGGAWWLGPLGGRIKVASSVARRWVDTHGADTRIIILDDVGEVVGVGRRAYQPPDWLRDAIVARDLHCTAPASTTSAVLCDIDHIQAWDDGGPTDAPNLTLLSRRWHTRKTNGQWHLDRHPDGTRTWTNTATGYQTRQPPRSHHRPPPRGP